MAAVEAGVVLVVNFPLLPVAGLSLTDFPAHVGSKGSKTKTKSLGKPNKVKLDGGNLPKNKKSATSYGAGGGQATPISPGLPFAGRIAGGGNRRGVYGNRYAVLSTRPSAEHYLFRTNMQLYARL